MAGCHWAVTEMGSCTHVVNPALESTGESKGRPLLVSHRLPVRLDGDSNRLLKNVGGVASSLAEVQTEQDMLWVGRLGTHVSPEQRRELQQFQMLSVDVTAEDANGHYTGYATQVLWPTLHTMPQYMRCRRGDFKAYQRVNKAFAETVARHAGEQPIFVNDYQLALVPQYLRQCGIAAPVAFFLHTPFPPPEVLASLPNRELFLEGILGADISGFQTYESMTNFVACVKHFLGLQTLGLTIATHDGLRRVGVFPIGVDFERIQATVQHSATQNLATELRRKAGTKLVLAVDRVDYTKGLRLRLAAFETFLRRYPDWVGKVRLVQIAVPTREGIAAFDDFRSRVIDDVARLNDEFGANRPVVDYRYGLLRPEELAAFYCAADVAWVASIKDGMNLVAIEYPSHRADNSGALLLSRFVGAADYLDGAILHNPWNAEESAEALHEALDVASRPHDNSMRRLRDSAQRLDLSTWAKSLLVGACEQATRARARGPEHQASWQTQLKREFADANSARLLLDYDGTLAEIVPRPEQAAPTQLLLRLLAALADLPDVHVTLVSGRSRSDLEQWLAHLDVELIAEHGLWRRAPRGAWERLSGFPGSRSVESAQEMFEELSRVHNGTWIEEKTLGLAWHYRAARPPMPPERAEAVASFVSTALASSPMRVVHGHKAIEVIPVGVDKHTAVRRFVSDLDTVEFALAAGDDCTDEDLMRGLDSKTWTIKVGSQESWARFRLPDPAAMRDLLEAMVQGRRDRHRRGLNLP